MRDVLAYTSIGELQASPLYGGIRELPQICMSSGFSKKLRDMGVFPHTTTFHELLKVLAGGWKSDSHRMSDLATISRVISSRIKKTGDAAERLWLTGCLKQSYTLWSAITMLEEAEARPEYLEGLGGRDIGLLTDIWRALEGSSENTRAIRGLKTNEQCGQRAHETISRVSGGTDADTVVVHGFYYITPVQERMLRVLESAGYRLLFLFQYDDAHPKANEVWRALYNHGNGFSDESEWLKVGASQRNAFGDLLENRTSDLDTVRLVEYRSMEEFVNDVEPGNESPFLFSPDATSANDMLREFYPEVYGRRPLISYPIGGFIELLHRMWDQDRDDLILEPDLLSECFSYGWLTYNGRRSNAYLADLQKMMPFFRGCKAESDWNERLRLLHEIQDEAVNAFQADPSDRWDAVLGNPLRNFSMFDVDDGGEAVVSLIGDLIRSARMLFGDGQGCFVDEHLRRLRSILDGEIIDDDVMREELGMASSTLDRLSSPGNLSVFRPTDMSGAVRMYLRNEYGSDDEVDEDLHVSPMYGLETIPYDRVHIVLANQRNLPGGKGDYIWPLNREIMRAMVERQSLSDSHPLLSNAIFVVETASIANRYLVYSAFWSGEVTLSWIRELDGKMHPPSPYIELISKAAGVDIDNIPYRRSTRHRIDMIGSSQPKTTPVIPKEVNVVCDVVNELSLCPRMFLYSYVLNRNPTFVSGFQQSFAMSGLLSVLLELQRSAGYDRASVEENLFALFPFLSGVEVQNIKDSRPRTTGVGTTRLNDRRYTDLRFDVRYPSPIKDILSESVRSIDMGKGYDVTGVEAKSAICMYCPHNHHCPEVRFRGDEDGD